MSSQGIIISPIADKYLNPPPSYSWEPLDLEEVFNLTNIKLKHEGWKTYFTNFHQFIDKKHTEECRQKHLHKGYTSCNCLSGPIMIAIWKAGTLGLSGVARGREFFFNIPYEKLEDNSILQDRDKRPEDVLEILKMGFESLITLLKVYEVTESILEFGPPMRLYREDDRKNRYNIREINGDILWNMLYREKEECLEENKVLQLQ